MNGISPNTWYSARDAAPHLEVVEQTVKNWCRQKKFDPKPIKRGAKKAWHVKGAAIIKKRAELGLS